MRTEKEIIEDIAKAKKAYLEANEILPQSQVAPLSSKVKELQKELAAILSAGAKPCPDCGNIPHGMRYRTQIISGVKIDFYEVGCLACTDHAARGKSPQEAVEYWNAGRWRKGEAEMDATLPFTIDRTAPDRPGVKTCCRQSGNLDWTAKDEERFIGVCKTCGCRHFVFRPIKKQENTVLTIA